MWHWAGREEQAIETKETNYKSQMSLQISKEGQTFKKWCWDNWLSTYRKQILISISHHTPKDKRQNYKAFKNRQENIFMIPGQGRISQTNRNDDKVDQANVRNFCLSKDKISEKITFVCSLLRKPRGADLAETGIHGKIRLERWAGAKPGMLGSHHLLGRQELESSYFRGIFSCFLSWAVQVCTR